MSIRSLTRIAIIIFPLTTLAVAPGVHAQKVTNPKVETNSVAILKWGKELKPQFEISLFSPQRLLVGKGKINSMQWTREGLATQVSKKMLGLAKVEKPGLPIYDPSSDAWYATANGQLVRLEKDGRLTVIAEDIAGNDVDVRANQGLAVSREADHTIVLHRFGKQTPEHRVLLRGEQYFYPRFSPDGQTILVSESHAGGGHFWTVTLDGKTTDQGVGDSATWHPDNRRIITVRSKNDGHKIIEADLYITDIITRQTAVLGLHTNSIELEPRISPDGKWLAFVDGHQGDIMLTLFPDNVLKPKVEIKAKAKVPAQGGK